MLIDCFSLLATRIAALEDSLAMTTDSHSPGYAHLSLRGSEATEAICMAKIYYAELIANTL